MPASARRGRWFLRGGVVLLLLIISLYFSVTTAPDRSPIPGSEAAQKTKEGLEQSAASMKTDSGRLRVGWARRSITPPLGSPTYGYTERFGREITEIGESLYVRAIALTAGSSDPVVLLTADICLWAPAVADSIERGVVNEIAGSFIYFGATHTHSGPGGYALGAADRFLMGGIDTNLTGRLIRSSIQAIRHAVLGLMPGSFRGGSAEMAGLIRNRLVFGDPVNERLLLLEFQTPGGRCAVISFDAHATTVSGKSTLGSPDYPGRLAGGLESSGFSEVLFFAGSTGQAEPFLRGSRASGEEEDIACEYGDSLLARMGRLTGSSAVFQDSLLLSRFSGEVFLPRYQYRFLGRVLREGVTSWLIGTPKPVAIVKGLRIGSILLIGHSFEYSSFNARSTGNNLRESGFEVAITGFNGRHFLYVVPEHLYNSEGYEPHLSLFGPSLSTYLDRITNQVALRLTAPED